jgi:cell division protein FtsB
VRFNEGQVLTIALFAAILVALGSLVLAANGVPNLVALQRVRQSLGELAVALLQQNSTLRDQIKRLRSDDRFLESSARHELGFVRSDETVYRFRRSAKPAQP